MPKDSKAELSLDIGVVKDRDIRTEMQESYLDYAMSVIVSRALPDVRDGLKPVHRRILYAMHEMGLRHNVKFRKSAAVVGDVLGKYHPHGDIAVYDSMVHMAQLFAMRYPLIDGQGNFGCFTGDTKVALTDGRNLSFIELVKEYKNGKTNFTYAFNQKTGLIEIVQIKKPRLTKKQAQLIEVELDNGDKIRCTPNHLFMMRDGTYKEAKNLVSGNSLMPAYFRFSTAEDDKNAVGYRMVWQPFGNLWDWAHRLADKYNLENEKYKINSGKVRHHLDFNKLNNNPDNIQRMQWGDHWRLHYNLTSEKHKNDPEYVLKLKRGREKYWENPENIEKRAKLMSVRNSKNWQDPEYREKMRNFLSAVNKEFIKNHPKKRKDLSLTATKTLKKLWQNSVYRSLMHEKIIKGNKNRTTNKTGKLKFLNICRKLSENRAVLNEENYQKARNSVYPYGSAPLWNTGLKYFQNSASLVLNELNGNHKIIKISRVAHTEDVYDLTIENFHNFALASGIFVHNSMDGDGAAAMRYTEARMSAVAEEILLDLDKETVDWRDNYDATRKEPVVLPGKLPNLLLNGTLGIAVGMATDIPPHNLGEICDAIIKLIEDPEATTEDLMEFVHGPDFPTGGIIYDVAAIKNAYATGKGGIVMRAKTEITESKSGAYQILVHEIPYRVNKATLLEKIAELVRDKKIEGIRDVRDESDKDGVRIVVDIKKDGLPNKILNQLFSYTQLQESFHMNMLALVDGIEPHVLNLKTVLEKYLEHRQIVVRKRTEFELKKAKERAHILEGLKKALDHIDEVINTIRKSPTKEEAKANLIKKFKLTDIQADAILEMRLQTLAGLERKKIDDELKEKKNLIEELEGILQSKKKILGIIKGEVEDMKSRFGDERRTQVIKNAIGSFSAEDLIPESNVIITITKSGYVKRLAPDTYKSQARGGKGVIGQSLKEEDVVEKLISSNTHDDILFFTNKGRVFQTKVYELPEGSRVSKGQALVNFLQLQNGETSQAVLTFSKKDDAKFLVMSTKKGLIKKTSRDEFAKVRRSGMIAITLKGDDELKWVETSSGDDQVMLSTENGQAIRFSEKDVRPMGRNASGVTGMRLKKDDKIISMDIIRKSVDVKTLEVLIVTENGLGKKTEAGYYKVQKRGGSGIKTLKVTPKTGKIVSMYILNNSEEHDLVIISKNGQTIRTPLNNVSTLGRATQGVRVMRLDEGDKVASATII